MHSRFFTVHLLTVLLLVIVCRGSVGAVGQRVFISIPILGVSAQGDKLVGATHYLAVQIDRLPDLSGPQVQFNEGSRAFGTLKGSALSPEWKDAARRAVDAAARALGEDSRNWLVTVKDVSNAYMTDGPSASAALAVGIVAALRGDALPANVAMTGKVEADGRISDVGDIPEKLQGAARSGLSVVLIPKGQLRTRDWDVRPLAETLQLTVFEVGTLREAYEKITGRGF
jgi:Lon protease (S16) C-terminal proteolytic domain